MKASIYSKYILSWLILVFAILSSSGCSSLALRTEETKNYLETPRVNDIYAVKCGDFFSRSNSDYYPYCLARVTEVSRRNISLVSADTSSKTQSDIISQLRDEDYTTSSSNIDWDIDEEIKVNRMNLLELQAQGSILEIRRLTNSEVERFITEISRRRL